jgi:hypothetical protein
MPRTKKVAAEVQEVQVKELPENFSLAKNVPEINNHDELAQWLRPVYIVNDYLEDKDKYDDLMKRLMNLMRACVDIYECRTYPIKFKFYKNDKKTHELEFRHFIVNMILWFPMTELSDCNIMDETFILNCDPDIVHLNEYINEKIIYTMIDYRVKSKIINITLSEVLYNLSLISIDFSLIMGLNFTLKTFINLYQTNPEARSIMETTFDRTVQPYEIEKTLNEKQESFVSILVNDPNNPIGAILKAGPGIKTKQLGEFAINGGLKPTLNGETIPIAVNNSILRGGANTPATYYISSIGSRKSLVMQKKVMGKAG